jgi:hypothetical protein
MMMVSDPLKMGFSFSGHLLLLHFVVCSLRIIWTWGEINRDRKRKDSDGLSSFWFITVDVFLVENFSCNYGLNPSADIF